MDKEIYRRVKKIKKFEIQGHEVFHGFGIEVEGFWTESHEYIKHDGSVKLQGIDPDCVAGQGEIRSLYYDRKRLEDCLDFIKSYYPDIVNSTCGMHFHFSCSNAIYGSLMQESFWNFFISNIRDIVNVKGITKEDKARQDERLEGNIRHCLRGFIPEEQVYKTTRYYEERYRFLNYCWKQKGTLECRVFTAFENYTAAEEVILRYLEMIMKYLKITPLYKRTINKLMF